MHGIKCTNATGPDGRGTPGMPSGCHQGGLPATAARTRDRERQSRRAALLQQSSTSRGHNSQFTTNQVHSLNQNALLLIIDSLLPSPPQTLSLAPLMDRPLGQRQPDKRNAAYEDIFGRPSAVHHQLAPHIASNYHQQSLPPQQYWGHQQFQPYSDRT